MIDCLTSSDARRRSFLFLVRLMNQYHLRDLFIQDMPGSTCIFINLNDYWKTSSQHSTVISIDVKSRHISMLHNGFSPCSHTAFHFNLSFESTI